MFRIGPAKILVSTAGVTAPAADWIDLGDTRGDVQVSPEVTTATGRTDQRGMAPLASGVYVLGRLSRVAAPLLERSLATLAEVVPGALRVEAGAREALGFGSAFGVATPVAVAVVPLDEWDAAGDWYWESEHAVWLPSSCFVALGQWTHALPEGDDAFPPYEVEIVNYVGSAGLAGAVRDAGGIGTIQTDLLGRVRPPTDLQGVAVGLDEVDLTWQDNAGNEDGYRIYRRVVGGQFAEIDEAPADAEAYADVTAAADTDYEYQVTGFNAGDESAPSNIVQVTTPAA